MSSKGRRTSLDVALLGYAIFLLMLFVLATLMAAPGFAGARDCVQAEIKRSVRLPHGQVLSPGLLRVCHGEHSENLHRTSLDGHPVALLKSRSRPTMPSDAAPETSLLFNRGRDGNLELAGYRVAQGGESVAYWFTRPWGDPPRHDVPDPKIRISEPDFRLASVSTPRASHPER